ncbi:TonB-dependent receptor [uncultured Sphingomonas sp.]|uniref:TonB-dependent siderophore receptor n=1 Tax=uncultured Sphingomonas sp. TaxID=158754 RepID=UPI00263228FD|nr:TonB-dependent receptor [uncultured Sphingomonas sp.]
MTIRRTIAIRLVATSIVGIGAVTLPCVASAQQRSLSQPAMPLGEALERIAKEFGKPLDIDPNAVDGVTANPVVDAHSEKDAVRQATRGLPVAMQMTQDGRIGIYNDIVVVAQRDEAETSVLVRRASTSSRLGQSLRDQPRNTQVISSKLIEEQQALTISEALANAGGVTIATTPQGGNAFSVRGFGANGSINGMPSTSNNNFNAGTIQPLGNIERIEVLKGPDAILTGGDNMGGNINIVTKKPSATERLYATAETGSFGLIRGTIDANRALTDDGRLSARVIATGQDMDRNFGGYRGTEEYLFAPSIRYKNADTDIILSTTQALQRVGEPPYTLLNLATGKPVEIDRSKPFFGGPDQGIRVGTSQFNIDATQKLTDWLTVVARGQHSEQSFALRGYSPVTGVDAAGIFSYLTAGGNQRANTDSIDAFARVNFKTGIFEHKIVAGYTYVDTQTNSTSATGGQFAPYDTRNPAKTPIRALNDRFVPSVSVASEQRGYYGQYLLNFSRYHLLVGLRKTPVAVETIVDGAFTRDGKPSISNEKTSPLSPNYGAVIDLSDNLSVFGSLAYGFAPNYQLGVDRQKLPDRTSRNAETGIKWDLFDERMLVTASYFSIREINGVEILPRVPGAPAQPRFYRSVPGRLAQGVDINLSGEPIRGLSLIAAFTRTDYDLLYVTAASKVVNNLPRDMYNFYASYTRPVADDVKLGLGAGVQGRSGAFVDRLGLYRLGPAVQANLNGILTVGKFDINLSIRNVFDRDNYGTSIDPSYIPLGEPRSFRLSVGYRFR